MNKILLVLKIILFLAVSVASWVFVKTEHNNSEYQRIKITVKDSITNCFVDKVDIRNFIRSKEGDFLGSKVNSANLLEIEKELSNNNLIAAAEVYNSFQWSYDKPTATLNVIVDQRDPIVRIYQEGKDYYVDNEGVILPWSPKYTSRVMTAHGNFNQQFAQTNLFELCSFINKDPFWKSQIDQILVNEQKEFTLIPRVGNHSIILGGTNQLQEKFRNLKAFYKQILPEVGWDKYRNVNVKFSDQIVCSK